MKVEAAQPSDAAAWLRMRCRLWPEGTQEEHREEIEAYFAGRFARHPWQVLVARDESAGEALGFVELSVRSYAEGCDGVEVAYLEGWYVESRGRRTGVGRALIAAAEDWARGRGLNEFASDASPDNEASLAAHRALGFEDAGLVQCFRKRLQGRGKT